MFFYTEADRLAETEVQTLAYTLACVKTKMVALVKEKTLADKLSSVEAKTLLDTLANTLAETEMQTLG